MIFFVLKMHSFTETLLEMHDIKDRLRKRSTVESNNFLEATTTTTTFTSVVTPRTKKNENSTQLDATLSRQLSELCRRHLAILKQKRRTLIEESSRPKSKNEVLSELIDQDLSTTPTLSFYCYYLFCPILVYECHYPE